MFPVKFKETYKELAGSVVGMFLNNWKYIYINELIYLSRVCSTSDK
jgi:hypothetical protein